MGAQTIFGHPTANGIPQIVGYKVKTGETFKAGAAVVVDANGELTECADDPALLVGFALHDAFVGPGYRMADNPVVITGLDTPMPVAVASGGAIFVGRGVNGGTDPVTPTQTMVGESFELAGNGAVWYLNTAGTASPVADVIRVDIDNKLFFFRIKPANIQA